MFENKTLENFHFRIATTTLGRSFLSSKSASASFGMDVTTAETNIGGTRPPDNKSRGLSVSDIKSRGMSMSTDFISRPGNDSRSPSINNSAVVGQHRRYVFYYFYRSHHLYFSFRFDEDVNLPLIKVVVLGAPGVGKTSVVKVRQRHTSDLYIRSRKK